MFAAGKTAAVSGETPDAQFNYVTMLLHGDGTNGAQNNTFLDSSSNNFTVTRNGNATQGSFSPYGSLWSVYKGDQSSTVAFNSNAGNFGSADWTIEFWMNCTGNNGYGAITQSTGGGAAATSWGFFIGYGTTNNIALYLSDGSSYFAYITAGTTACNDGKWHHVAASRSGSTAYLFLDGVLQGTTSVGSTALGNGGLPIHIGGQATGSYALTNGYFSNVRIIKGSGIYTSAFTPSTSNLTAVAGTSLLTCQSNRFLDNSSNNYTPSINGTPSVQRFSPFAPTTAYSTATIGGSAIFDGSGDYLGVANNSAFDLSSNNWMIECWMYQTSSSGNQSICSKYEPSYQSSWSLDLVGANWDVYIYYGSTSYTAVYTGAAPALNQWNHVVLQRNGSYIEFYVNGVRLAQVAAQTIRTTTSAIRIGDLGSGYSGWEFRGYLSDVRIVNGSAIYSGATFTPPTSPLTAVTNTKLLCNMSNAAITDNAMMNDLETVGNAQISTSVVKYGTGSLKFTGAGDALKLLNTPQMKFGAGPSTIEFWMYPTASPTGGFGTIIGDWTTGASAGPSNYLVCVDGTNVIFYATNGNYNYYDASQFAVSTTYSNNVWTHIALSFDGTTMRFFKNGTLISSNAFAGFSTNAGSFTNPISIGATPVFSSSYGFIGYIDDLRVTKGYARYTTTFTPPTAALPDKGPI